MKANELLDKALDYIVETLKENWFYFLLGFLLAWII